MKTHQPQMFQSIIVTVSIFYRFWDIQLWIMACPQIQGHWKCHQSMDHIRFTISLHCNYILFVPFLSYLTFSNILILKSGLGVNDTIPIQQIVYRVGHYPDNVKFPDISRTVHSTPAHVKYNMYYSYHTCTTNYHYGRKHAANNKQATRLTDKIISLTLPWLLVKSLTFHWQLSKSLVLHTSSHPAYTCSYWHSQVTMAVPCVISKIKWDTDWLINCNFFIPHLHSTPPLGGSPVGISPLVWKN